MDIFAPPVYQKVRISDPRSTSRVSRGRGFRLGFTVEGGVDQGSAHTSGGPWSPLTITMTMTEAKKATDRTRPRLMKSTSVHVARDVAATDLD